LESEGSPHWLWAPKARPERPPEKYIAPSKRGSGMISGSTDPQSRYVAAAFQRKSPIGWPNRLRNVGGT
jgi:hypothetical protein